MIGGKSKEAEQHQQHWDKEIFMGIIVHVWQCHFPILKESGGQVKRDYSEVAIGTTDRFTR